MSDTADRAGPVSAEVEPTEDERNFAMLAHLLQFFAGFIPPLVIFLVKRKSSRFVAFHALQALLWQIAYFVIIMLGMIAIFASVFGMILHQQHAGGTNNAPPMAFFVGFGSFWLLFMIGWFGNIFLAIFYSIKAHEGKWTNYPIFGRLARRILHT